MEIRREKTAENNGEAAIRLRYSRQFQHGGQAHTIDAETTLAVGADPEQREQAIRALEAGVEQLARQIVQRGTRPAGEARPAAPVPPRAAAGRTPEPVQKVETNREQPTAPLPVSESMPATPAASGGRTISLPYFIDYIKKRWNMSPKEAMDLLEVRELTGLNYREALYKLRAMKEPQSVSQPGGNARSTTPPAPVSEASRQTEPYPHSPRAQADSPTSSASMPGPVTGLTAPRYENRSISRNPPSTAPAVPPVAAATGGTAGEAASTQEREDPPDFAGSPKAPLPIQLGVVRDAAARTAYRFEEEEEEEYDLPDDGDSDMMRQSAQFKLEELREVRGSNAASTERLGALNNVIGEQISADQLEKLIQAIWGITNRKRLKAQQVEALISWAKEDLFVEEAEAILRLLDEGEV